MDGDQMKDSRQYKRIRLTDRGSRRQDSRHPWVYDNEIFETPDGITDGDLVDVITSSEKYVGTGFYNSNSKIRVRIISRNANDTFDQAFWERRVGYALDFRKTVMRSETDLKCCRLIFGEADEFPGLTVDRFNDILVAQVLSLGIEVRKDMIFEAILNILPFRRQRVHFLTMRLYIEILSLELLHFIQ